MKLKYIPIALFFLLLKLFSFGQNHHQRFRSIDIQHYAFIIYLNDSTNSIEGKTTIEVKFLQNAENCVFDLVNVGSENKGMSVESVNVEDRAINFTHIKNKLKIDLGSKVDVGNTLEFQINYAGVPADGLVISENSHGKRTFFGDNWPDRAQHWLPCVDHPSDKATLEFKVYAPSHYDVVSNGYQVEQKQLENGQEFTHWKTDVPISTKLMVIGVADFAIGNQTIYKDIPVNSWIFKADTTIGFQNYKYGTEALEYFSQSIGPYSYEKLAHVQSKTRYGGMENASCIFYHERTATGNKSQEGLFAHEVAHQWFGNSVTEQNWHHLWLSEGFATYLTHVYKQHFYGEEIFREGLKNDRDRVINYAKHNLAPIIDTTITEYIQLLNTNSYQKASWFLHMLRMDLGDDIFFKGLRNYYADFRNSTALTEDFRKVMEAVSGKDLKAFFQQWLWQAGHPVLNFSWEQKEDQLSLKFKQTQQNVAFTFPIEIEFHFTDGTSKTEKILINKSNFSFVSNYDKKVDYIILDPTIKLLFELQ